MQSIGDSVIKYRRYSVLLGAFLLNLTIGNLYTYNNMAPNIVKFMQNRSYSGHSVNEGNAVWIFGMGIFGMGSSITLGDFFVKRLGPSMTVLFAGWLMSSTVLMMSYTLQTYLAVVALTYGFINGIGTGIVYGVSISTGCSWFPDRKGTAAGFIVAGFGFSAFLIDLAQSKFVNQPKDIEYTLDNVPISYLLLGCIFLVIQFIGAMLLTNPPMEEVIIKSSSNNFLEFKDDEQIDLDIRPHNLIIELDFWVLWCTYSLLSACFALIISLHKLFGSMLGFPDNDSISLTLASSLGSLFNCLGRIFWGFVIDKVRYKIVMLILTPLLTIFLATFYSPAWIIFAANATNYDDVLSPTMKHLSISIYFIWIMLLYFIPSGMFSIFPYTCFKLFGKKNFVSNYGMLFTAYSFGGLITSCITTYIWNGENKDPHLHFWAFTSGAVMAALAGLITFIYRGRSLIRNMKYF